MILCARPSNANRRRIVSQPADHAWSSYRANAFGEADALLSPHEIYLSLGATDAQRQAAYRAFVDKALDPETLEAIRACLQTGTPLGDDRFREQIEQALGVKVGYAKRGRRRKVKDESMQLEDQQSLDLQ